MTSRADSAARRVSTWRSPAVRFGAGLWLAVGVAVPALAQSGSCGDLGNNYGPFDYRLDRSKLPIVERYHFTPQIEALVSGGTAAKVEDDISYTLRAFPNHARALAAVVRLAEREKSPHPKGLQYSVDCYFQRALRFRDDDTIVRMLYAQWLGKTNRRDAGVQQLDVIDPGDNPLTVYNLGLVYAELGGYGKALELAHRARDMGDPRSALREILEKAGQWRDLPQPAPAAAASAVDAAGAER